MIADSYDPPRLLIGETPVWKPKILASYYGEGDELDLAFNFILLESPFEADAMHEVIETTLAALPQGCQAVWAGGNHDVSRFPTRWAGNSPARARAAPLMLLTLPGTPFLYAGDEILMPDTDVPRDRLKDPLGVQLYPMPFGRDPERTPWPPAPRAPQHRITTTVGVTPAPATAPPARAARRARTPGATTGRGCPR